MAFDIEGARKAGYTDAEIATAMASAARFDIGAARKHYSDGEIIATLEPKLAAPARVPIPGQEGEPVRAAQARIADDARLAARTPMDQAIGLGEAGLSAVTGATGGTVGMIGGAVKGIAQEILSGKFGTPQANDLVAQSMNEGAAALTYAPRTEVGQERAQQLGNVMANVLPVAPLAGEMAGISAGVKAARSGAPAGVLARAGAEGTARDAANLVARPAEVAGMVAPGAAGDAAAGAVVAAGDVAARGAAAVKTGAQRVAEMSRGATTLPRRALDALRGDKPEAAPTPGTMGSAGAAGTDAAAQRVALAESLPVPVKLTKGMATRDADQLKFEVETAKMPEVGKPLRDNRIQANDALLRNMDWAVDQTGAEAPSLRAVGNSVDKALVADYAKAKTAVRTAYKAAEKAGEMESPVTLDSVVQHISDSAPDAATAPLLDVARKRAVQLGLAIESPDGALIPQPVTLKTAETFRQAINRATDFEPTNVRQSTIIKGLVDEATDGKGGDLYRAARSQRAQMAQRFEDRAVIAKLLNTKRGMADRQVALEDVFDHSVMRGSLDDVRHVRRVLQTAGPDGVQAWKELQGQTLKSIRDKATTSVAADSSGNRVLSPASLDKSIRELDADGKLTLIFGKQGAQFLRDLNELAQIAKTVPPEAGVNYSNTSSALLAALGDASVMGFTGAPVPVVTLGRFVSRYVKDRALKQRINEALRNAPIKAPGRRGGIPEQFPGATATVH
mgnify:CR=1 FL=1